MALVVGGTGFRGFLNRFNHRRIGAFTLAFAAGDEAVLRSISVESVVQTVERYLWGLPFFHFLGLHFVFAFVDLAFPPFTRKVRPMTWLKLERQLDYLERWSASRFPLKRLAFMGVKYVCLTAIYSEPKLLESIGYGPAMAVRFAPHPRAKEYPDESERPR